MRPTWPALTLGKDQIFLPNLILIKPFSRANLSEKDCIELDKQIRRELGFLPKASFVCALELAGAVFNHGHGWPQASTVSLLHSTDLI